MDGDWEAFGACIAFTFRPSPAPSPGAVSPIHHTIVRGHLDTNSLSLGIGSRIIKSVSFHRAFSRGAISAFACLIGSFAFWSIYIRAYLYSLFSTALAGNLLAIIIIRVQFHLLAGYQP